MSRLLDVYRAMHEQGFFSQLLSEIIFPIPKS